MSTNHPHTAKTVFFGCIDDRLGHTFTNHVEAHGKSFHPSLAGGGAAFLDEAERAVALKQIVAPFLISGVTEVYLQSHTDCGAYRLAGVTFATPEEELSRLYSDLDDAADHVRAALVEAGAREDNIIIHTQVVDPTGAAQERTEPATLIAR